MNIFFLDKDPKICAEMHVDKHTVKMILEYAQLLSTAHRVLDGVISEGVSATGRKRKSYVLSDYRENILYSATHINHPSAVWVRHSAMNYHWLYTLLVALCKEYTYRYIKTHKVESSGLLNMLQITPKNINAYLNFTEPTPAMPDSYKVVNDSIQSYKNYYLGEKQRMFSWKNRSVPNWITK